MFRVAHVITRLIVGGAQENTVACVLGLRQKADLQLSLIAGPTTGPEGSIESELASAPGLLTLVPELVRPIHPWKDVRAWQKLVRLFRAQSPHIVHTHSGKAGIVGRLAAHRVGIPLILHTIHGPSFGPFQGALANRVFVTAERLAGRYTTHFVVVAEAMARQYLAAGIGHPDQYTRIVSGFPLGPYLTATNDPAERARWGIAPGDFVVGKIARLFDLKGHLDLFAIAAQLARSLPHIKFLLVGDGLLRAAFEQRLRELGLTQYFIFTGLVPPSAIPRLVGIMDVLVHLSRREGLPRALPQGLAAARPVVAFDCDGAREVCLNDQTGFLVPAGEVDQLAQRLLQLARDPGLRERLGQAGRRLVQSWFPVEKMVDDLDALYHKLIQERHVLSA